VVPSQLDAIKQRTFEFSFQVDLLQASLSKTNASGEDVDLANAVLEHFELDFALEKYEMHVDVELRYVAD
jgi:vacuolar protein sorting-associated protein 13A/C